MAAKGLRVRLEGLDFAVRSSAAQRERGRAVEGPDITDHVGAQQAHEVEKRIPQYAAALGSLPGRREDARIPHEEEEEGVVEAHEVTPPRHARDAPLRHGETFRIGSRPLFGSDGSAWDQRCRPTRSATEST